jgi:hypothetical protein
MLGILSRAVVNRVVACTSPTMGTNVRHHQLMTSAFTTSSLGSYYTSRSHTAVGNQIALPKQGMAFSAS